jgi:protein-glucosylgalactosylhydroxylysine glucosidase
MALRRAAAGTIAVAAAAAAAPIDRRAVVARHSLAVSAATGAQLDPFDVFSVGNGDIAFNVDATGAQSLNETYASVFDLNTLSSWQFHTIPFAGPPGAGGGNPRWPLEAFNFTRYDSPVSDGANRSVPYATNGNLTAAAAGWLHSNPHRLNLLQLAVVDCAGVGTGGGQPCATLAAGGLANLTRSLDLWAGLHTAGFSMADGTGRTVGTSTAVHPDLDVLALRVGPGSGSADPRVGLRFAFPYATGAWGPSPSEWRSQYDGAHVTEVSQPAPGGALFTRTLDADGYVVACAWSDPSWGPLVRTAPHAFELRPPPANATTAAAATSVDVVCLLAPRGVVYPVGASAPWLATKAAATAALLAAGPPALPSFDAVAAAAAGGWGAFWNAGAFVDLAGGTRGADPTALELERRVVLSLYLTRVHSAGASPPQETGLLCNSWSGKRHSEMRFWHHGHWPLWMRPDLLARSDGALADELPNATAYAAAQGYDGARWPKMVAEVNNRSGAGLDVPWYGQPGGGANAGGDLLAWESVNTINPVLVWHQPSPILLAEMQRRAANASAGGDAAARAVMARLWPVVAASASFHASFVYASGARGGYSMGPPLMGGEEEGSFLAIHNPAYELTAFAVALDTASDWAAVLTGARNATWDAVARGMAPRALDAGSPPGMPLYAPNAAASCCYLRHGFTDPGCPPTVAARGLTQCSPTNSHPLMVGQHGMVNGAPAGDPGRYGLDVTVLNNTLAAVAAPQPGAGGGATVWGNWSWGGPDDGANVWGWDWGLTALAMARLGWDPAVITAWLVSDFQKNRYLRNGVNFQSDAAHGGDNLPAYLPGNGALLLAVGALAAGTAGSSPPGHFPVGWAASVEGFGFAYP